MLNEKFRWNKSHNLSIVQISDCPLINLLPSGVDSNIYAFEENGFALHVQGLTRSVIEKIKLSDHKLSAVEGVQVDNQDRFLVADSVGNLLLYNYQFIGVPIDLGKRVGPVHSIVDIGLERGLVAYNCEKNVVVIELIEVITGHVIDSLKFNGTQIIRDMHCQDSYGESDVKIFVGTHRCVIELQVKNGKLSTLGIEHVPPNQYIDEVFGEDSLSRIYLYRFVPDDPKEKMHPSSKGIWSYDPDEKLCTVSHEFDAKVMTERGVVRIVPDKTNYCRTVYIDKEVIYRHIHFPANQIIGVTLSGKIIYVDFRSSISSFLWD